MKSAYASKEIEFECPNCHQRYKSATYQDGMDCACQNCNFQFTILAIEPHAEIPAERISAPRPGFAAKAAAVLTTDLLGDEDRKQTAAAETAEARELRTLLENAAWDNTCGSFLITLAIIGMIIGVIIALNGERLGPLGISGAIAGPALVLGLILKVISRLDFIRAEIKAQKRP
jgi:DNA-directed RNA polymerase subunit RPC12/RpoP